MFQVIFWLFGRFQWHFGLLGVSMGYFGNFGYGCATNPLNLMPWIGFYELMGWVGLNIYGRLVLF